MIPDNTLQRQHLSYRGRVQGVGFRYTAQRVARGYHVTGFVRNLPDRTVELVVEGQADEIGRYLAELAEVMSGHILGVDVRTLPGTGEFAEFEIRH